MKKKNIGERRNWTNFWYYQQFESLDCQGSNIVVHVVRYKVSSQCFSEYYWKVSDERTLNPVKFLSIPGYTCGVVLSFAGRERETSADKGFSSQMSDTSTEELVVLREVDMWRLTKDYDSMHKGYTFLWLSYSQHLQG